MAAITDTNRPVTTQYEDVIDEADPGISEVYIDIAGVQHSRPVMENDTVNDFGNGSLNDTTNDNLTGALGDSRSASNGSDMDANDIGTDEIDGNRGLEAPAVIDPALEPDIQSPTIDEPNDRRPDLDTPGRGYDAGVNNNY